MKKNIIFSILFCTAFVCCALQGCSTEEVHTYKGRRSLYFKKYEYNPETARNDIRVDTANISFSHYIGESEITHEFTVCLAGDTLSQSLEYELVLDEETTAKKGQYSLPDKLIFKSGDIEDKLPITIYKDKLEDGEEVLLRLRLIANDNFGLAFSLPENDYTLVSLRFNNKVSKPLWWKGDIELAVFGKYSFKKFETIVAANSDFTTADGLSLSELRKIALRTKEYIKEHSITEEDGSPMEIPMY